MVNYIIGFRGEALGIRRVQDMLHTMLARRQDIHVNRVGFSTPHPKLQYPIQYSYFPVKVFLRALQSDGQAVNHIAHHHYAHLLNVLPLKRTVVTCYDLIELTQLEAGEASYRCHRRGHILAAFRGMLRADRIIAISEYTKRTIVERSAYPEERIVTVYPGVDTCVFDRRSSDPGILHRYGLREDETYLLYVGSEQPRKNLKTLIGAFALARQQLPHLKLVKVGAHQTPDGRRELLAEIARLGLENYCHLIGGYIPEEDLVSIYNAATVFVFPSLLEGFGLPVLEAMACGVPVVASNSGALPEVVGDAGWLVEPKYPEEFAKLIIHIVSNPDLANRFALKGLERAQRFVPDKMAARVVEVYRQIIGEY